ncbi:hypothetical protein J4H86_14395 [Spiractinospora alimapuensis]|uniref:hypothetical protein n=1 Tax=Spiractinospora alimapuensis TaxID=2820884 RepID=UPI001F231451|nr:hypothetical protein [Spiractinospora alimapuensis]QVQ50149.1 hypothetical protein J4H86_14395 [Spiractinospora alimapuensis]
MLTHRLLCPSTRLGEVREVLRPDDAIDLVLIVNEGIDGVAPAVAEIAAEPRLRLVALECPVYALETSDPAGALALALGGLEGARIPFEVSLCMLPAHIRQSGVMAAAIAERDHARPVAVKLWCGPDAEGEYPTDDDLAGALCSVARVGGETRAAAGLHHTAVRTPSEAGPGPHGFLNLVLAAADAATGEDFSSVAETLRVTDTAAVVERLLKLTHTQARAARRLLTTFGAADPRAPIRLAQQAGIDLAEDEIGG